MSTWVNNDEIPEWWVTRANNNETTTVTVDPSVVVKYAGVSVPAKIVDAHANVQHQPPRTAGDPGPPPVLGVRPDRLRGGRVLGGGGRRREHRRSGRRRES
jgi:hypothetical protein